MTRLTAWSFSRWSQYERCPLSAKYKFIDKLPEPEDGAMGRGLEVHKGLAEFLNGKAEMPKEGQRFAELLHQLKSLEPLSEQQWGYTAQWRPTGWFGRDTWFRSVLDAATIYEDNTADVVDFKTGKESPTHALQAELYALSIFVRYPVTHVTVRFWYLDLGTESVYRFAKADVQELIGKWNTRTKAMLNDTTFAPKPGRHCAWCAFAKSKNGPCRFG